MDQHDMDDGLVVFEGDKLRIVAASKTATAYIGVGNRETGIADVDFLKQAAVIAMVEVRRPGSDESEELHLLLTPQAAFDFATQIGVEALGAISAPPLQDHKEPSHAERTGG